MAAVTTEHLMHVALEMAGWDAIPGDCAIYNPGTRISHLLMGIDVFGPGKRYQYIYELCTGCAICFEQCPCHSISMIPEPSPVA